MDPSWPPAPPGWEFWVADGPSVLPRIVSPIAEDVVAQPAWQPSPEPARGPVGGLSRPVLIAVAVVVVLVVVAGVSMTLLTGRHPGTQAGSPGSITPVMVTVPTVLILDASGSMTTTDAPGPRIDAAKRAATGLVEQLPDTATLGLITYGTGTGSSDAEEAAGCRDVRILTPVGALDRAAVTAAINGLTPSGYTPISLALLNAANLLPSTGNEAIVLVSDGEDTCGQPPCDTAKQIKAEHPDLSISTVGFKTDGPASEQLSCVANVTGGLFVVAANANQLATRLLATQNIDQASSSLSSTGIGGIDLGTSIGDIRAKHPDFPDAATTGSVTVVWRDCEFTFGDGTLTSIAPHNGGRTIDGITAGSAVSKATELYGNPTAKQTSGSTGTLFYTADEKASTAYKMTVEGYAETAGTASGTIRTITLCKCGPRRNVKPEGVTEVTFRNMTFPADSCTSDSGGWTSTVPITVTDGKGEARTPSGEFGGATITGVDLVGWFDVNGDGTEDVVLSIGCMGFTLADCCAGRSSNGSFIGVFDFSTPKSPQRIGDMIGPGISPARNEVGGEDRRIDQVRIDGSAIITDEKLVYPDTSGASADLGYSPYATIEVTHRFTDGRWTSTERVIG